MNIFNKYGILKYFNHRKREKSRICLIFKILTHQPIRNNDASWKSPRTRISYLRRFFENSRRRSPLVFKVRRRRICGALTHL